MTDKNKARDAAFALNDISVLGGIVRLLESNNLRTEIGKDVCSEAISLLQYAQARITRDHDADMRSIGI